MGMFDRLLKRGLKAVENAVGDVVTEAITDTIKGKFGTSGATEAPRESSRPTSHTQIDNRSFDEKLSTIVKNIGDYEIRTNISPKELEEEAGYELYKRGGCYALPNDFSYALYHNGERKLYINLWYFYEEYRRMANRKLKEYCDNNNIKMLDFFDYMPNEADYMEDRIRKALV